jgi:hypothetical protein
VQSSTFHELQEGSGVACPFFLPIEKLAGGTWLHAERLPLGCGWSGHCTAPGYEGTIPTQEELTEFCNLGYAEGCRRFPVERTWDSVRFGARTLPDGKRRAGGSIRVRYVCERGHRPVEHGELEFNADEARWEKRHHDSRLQRMAECFLTAYVEKKKDREAVRAAS